MSDNPKLQDDPQDNAVKDPSQWVTGDEPATGAQLSYLHTLAEAAGEAMQQQITADRDPAAAPLHLQTPHLTPDDWAQGPAVLAIQTLVRPARGGVQNP